MDDILLAVDGNEGTETAIERGISLADQYGANLHILYVVDTGAVPALADSAAVIEKLQNRGDDALEDAVERAERAGLDTIETNVEHDRPSEGILEYAEENDVDLIVMGTRGRAGLERRLLGSVSDRVVRLAEIPVLTVPDRE
ncbi:universal stress protein [Natronomonas marina]|jgi:nucleotide-binding universal stress UspA family protein|uniref:universal stress protein n=1 Tax=Natronomonas marina TaxID=2961939 RepID=UPI0020C9B503|nr:universal stress protein [Natronomonas marina]